jgi:hypothetical protein
VGGWSTSHPSRFTPGKRNPIPTEWEAGWAPNENLALTEIRSPNRSPSQGKAGKAMALKEKTGWKKRIRQDESYNTECWKKNGDNIRKIFRTVRQEINEKERREIRTRRNCGSVKGRVLNRQLKPYGDRNSTMMVTAVHLCIALHCTVHTSKWFNCWTTRQGMWQANINKALHAHYTHNLWQTKSITYSHSCIVHILHIIGKISGDFGSQDRRFGKPKVKVGWYLGILWPVWLGTGGGAGVLVSMACKLEMWMPTFTAICGILSDEREKVLPMYETTSQTRWAVM